MKPRSMLTIKQASKVDVLKPGSLEFGLMRSLRGILRSGELNKLDIWIDVAVNSDLAPIIRLARVLHREFGAVRNAVELPWSNGQLEG